MNQGAKTSKLKRLYESGSRLLCQQLAY